MSAHELKSVETPDQTMPLPKARIEIVRMDSGSVLRYTMEPGWTWTDHLKPVMGTELCEVPHYAYQISGRLGVRMKDGTEFEVHAGDVHFIPAGHDAWVIGDEPVVGIDWTATTT